MANKETVGCSVGPCFTLFIVFLVLQLTHVIDWSWWWVTAPLWIPFALFLAIMVFIAIISILVGVFDDLS